MQITAEQLLREAAERQQEADFKKPKQKIVDTEELAELQLGKRQAVQRKRKNKEKEKERKKKKKKKK